MRLSSESFIESRFISEGQVNIKNVNIPYKVISEDNVLCDNEGKPAGSVFSFSYFRSDVQEQNNRPVVFVYNGGPGSSSLWLHLGFLGPKRVKIDNEVNPPICPPIQIEDNPHCLLDICDIVLIDPVETGYGRLIDEEAASQFFGIEQDAYSMALFIEGWLTKYDRWGSPKFLAGESYGAVRSCVLSSMLMGGPSTKAGRLIGVPINGIIMIGSAIHFYGSQGNVEPSVIELPTMAATSWYHNHEGKPDIKTFVEEAYRFSYKDYLKALFLGNYLPEIEKTEIIHNLSYYTGISEDYFIENGLCIDIKNFASQLLKEKDLEVGIYDGRYLLKRSNSIGSPDPVADDPAMGQYTPSFISAMNNIIKKELNITFDRTYSAINFSANRVWNNESDRTPLEYLMASMRRNNKMRVFFATGYYDLCTVIGEVRYIVSHMNMPSEQVAVKEYPSGHMPYLGEESAKMLECDLRTFINEDFM